MQIVDDERVPVDAGRRVSFAKVGMVTGQILVAMGNDEAVRGWP
jgi:hypothetical protein